MKRVPCLPRFPTGLLAAMAVVAPMIVGCTSVPTGPVGEEGRLKPLTIAAIKTPEGEQGTQVVIQASRRH